MANYDDGEPDESWVTGTELTRNLNLHSGNFSQWIRKYPNKLKRLHCVGTAKLVPPALQAEYLRSKGANLATKLPKGYIGLKKLPFSSKFLYNRRHLISDIRIYKCRIYISKKDANWLTTLYKDLSTPVNGYLKLADFAKQEKTSVRNIRYWQYRNGEKFKRYIVGSGGKCCYISPKQQRKFRARRKRNPRKETK